MTPSRLRAASWLAAALAFCVATTALPASPRAQDGTVAAFDQTFQDWMRRQSVSRGLFAIARNGRVVHARSFGMPADAPVPVASLSKAVTAACIATLIQQGKLRFDMPLSQALARTFQRLGAPDDPRLPEVTIAQLLTHRAGYQRSGEQPDPVTGAPLARQLRTRSATQPAIDEQTRALLRLKLPLAPGERYAYTNATYLLLGAVVEEATGAAYESHCRSAVLAPAGIAEASLSRGWRVLSSYGGWEFTAQQYLRFHEIFSPRGAVLSGATRQWLLSPEGKAVDGGAHYGLGTYVRHVAGSQNFWHSGRWRYQLTGGADGALSSHYGTFVARLGAAGYSWFAYFEPAPDGATGDLDRRMTETGRAVKRWP